MQIYRSFTNSLAISSINIIHTDLKSLVLQAKTDYPVVVTINLAVENIILSTKLLYLKFYIIFTHVTVANKNLGRLLYVPNNRKQPDTLYRFLHSFSIWYSRVSHIFFPFKSYNETNLLSYNRGTIKINFTFIKNIISMTNSVKITFTRGQSLDPELWHSFWNAVIVVVWLTELEATRY
jgi:hypothetical protein